MITTSHLIYNWAVATATDRDSQTGRTGWFVAGALLPDTPTYVLFFIHTLVFGTSQRDLWSTIYFDSAWTPFITLSHSLWLWPLLIALGYAVGRQWLTWLATSATLHVVMDFFVHADDAYRHFWPFTDWKFQSPISYWDPNFYGSVVGTIDTVVILLVLIWLWTRYTNVRIRILIAFLAVGYLVITFTPVVGLLFS